MKIIKKNDSDVSALVSFDERASWKRALAGVSWLCLGCLCLVLFQTGCQTRQVVRRTPPEGLGKVKPPVQRPGLTKPEDLEEVPDFLEEPLPFALLPAQRKKGALAHRLPLQVRSWMPLGVWRDALPVLSSPALPSCRGRLARAARRDRGRLTCRCSRAAGRAFYRSDCSGWIRCVFSRFGVDAFVSSGYRGSSGTFSLFHFFQQHGYVHRGRPRPGDVVFWHATIDRNRNRQLRDDPLTHVGIVSGVDADGRVRILHTGYSPRPRVHEIYMYLAEPSLYRRKDSRGKRRTYNSYLVSKRRRRGRPRRWAYTTGELFAGFATLRVCPDRIIQRPR